MIRAMGCAVNLALWVVILVIASMYLGGCATTPDNELPCDAHTCSAEDINRQTRDPFPAEPISFGSIFGAQPDPGKITVEPKQ